MKTDRKRSTPRIDPVCLMNVPVGGNANTYTYDLQTYFFCADSCRKAFIANPLKFIQSKPPKRKGWWGRYLDRLNKATGGEPPRCH